MIMCQCKGKENKKYPPPLVARKPHTSLCTDSTFSAPSPRTSSRFCSQFFSLTSAIIALYEISKSTSSPGCAPAASQVFSLGSPSTGLRPSHPCLSPRFLQAKVPSPPYNPSPQPPFQTLSWWPSGKKQR